MKMRFLDLANPKKSSMSTALIVLGLGILSLGCNRTQRSEFGPKNTRFISKSEPETLKVPISLDEGLDFSLSQSTNWHAGVDRELRRLEHHIRDAILTPAVDSGFLAPKLTLSGIDRQQSADTYSDTRIEVSRWRYSKDAPQFDDLGLSRLVENLYGPWKSSHEFRTELTAHQIKREGDQLVVTVLAKSHGEIRINVGLESTSMWSTRWNIISELADEIELASIKVLAHEEVKYSVSGNTVFKDVTKRVLSLDETLSRQLGYSIDQWSKWIPGLDLTGNHGIAIGDPNDDGFEDIYVCQPHGLPNLLLSQNPDGTAENTAKSAHLDILDESRAALFVDLDNDGDDDLVVSTSEELLLLSNDGLGVFQLEHGLLAGYDGGSLSAADYDNDGDLDLFVCKYNDILNERDLLTTPSDYTSAGDGGRNVLLRNDEGWNFTDVTESVGLKNKNIRYSRCALWYDVDVDGDMDLYVVNEFSEDTLYENKDGWFTDLNDTVDSLGEPTSGRSASIADFDADGRLDLFVANHVIPEAKRYSPSEDELENPAGSRFHHASIQDSRVFYATGAEEGYFRPFRMPSPIFSTQSTYGSSNVDLNNDGFEDILITNGLYTRSPGNPADCRLESLWIRQALSEQDFSHTQTSDGQKRLGSINRAVTEQIRMGSPLGEQQRNTCFLGMGKTGFANFSGASGFDFMEDARAVATVDWDQDGDQDIVMTTRNSPQLRILGNQMDSGNQFLSLRLKGTQSNRNAIGARVELFLDKRESPLVKAVSAGSGAFSQASRRLHFGIPKSATIAKVVVYWPSGLTQTHENVQADTAYEIEEGRNEPAELSDNRFEIRLFEGSESAKQKPLEFARSVFYPPVGLPTLQFQGQPQGWIPLKNVDDMPILALFVDDSQLSRELLRSFARESKEISSSSLDVVAIKIDGDEPDSASQFEAIRAQTSLCEFPFRFGAASASMRSKIKLLYGQWFSDQHIPNAPFAWLIDKTGRVRVAYPSGDIRANRVLQDLTFITGGMRMTADRASPFEGVWLCQKQPPNYSRLQSRFADLGYVDDQELFEELSRPLMANQLCRRAMELHAQGDSDEAKAAFASALDHDPNCDLACIEYGNLLIQESSNTTDEVIRLALLGNAQALFEKAIQVNPTNARAILGRAEVAKHRNQIDEAINQLKNYLEINPDRWEVHAIIGRLHFHKRKFRQATVHLLKAWENRPTLPFVAGDLGFLYMNSGAYEESRSFLRFATRLQPSAVNLKRHLAHAEFLTGNYDTSVELLKQVVVQQPNQITPKSLLAWQLATCPYETLRDGQESLKIASILVKVYDDSVSIHEICAAAYAELGDFDKALSFQQKAMNLLDTESPIEAYSPAQIEGLKSRLELYKRKRPYRMSDFSTIPIRQPGT